MKITEEVVGNAGVKYVFEYEDADSFDNLPSGQVRQAYAVCFVGEKMIVVHKTTKVVTSSWSLIGGTIESGETFEEALAREIHEEGNLKMLSAKPIGFQKATDSRDGSAVYQLRYVCTAEPFGPFEKDPAGGIDKVEFIDPKDYKNYFDWGKIGERIMERACELRKGL